MQRIFTTFPNSWPGAGLLLLRLVLAASILQSWEGASDGQALPFAVRAIELAFGLSLSFGLWTPVASVGQFVLALVLFVTGLEENSTRQLFSLSYISLAALGPGAWSADAYLYGRRRMSIDSK
jgi:putative oxidoreductase